MKDTLLKQFESLNTRYGWLAVVALKNMRLLLLILFAGLALYLVNRVNTLVNSDGSNTTSTSAQTEPQTPTSSISKNPDADVLSAFNELSVQEVQLDSNFDSTRDNPF